MESFFGRYKNPLVLMAVLFVQIIALATQVKRPSDPKAPNSPGTRLIRVWVVTIFSPIESAFVDTGHFFRHGWRNYVDLHNVRKQNQELQAEVTRLRMEEVQMKEDAEQGRRLQAVLGFREKFISQTLVAQVIGTSGSEQSRVIYIDKGLHDGIKADMAVITPDGIVGKIKDVFPLSSQVLMINDRDSGAGVILEKSRLQGVLRGANTGELQVDGVMADQPVETGERVIASGGDRIYPKGLPVGNVTSVAPDRDTGTFLAIKIKPAADLNRLEEVLVVTKMAEQDSAVAETEGPVRAADILAQRLPSVPKTTQQQPGAAGTTGASGTSAVDDKKNPKTAPGLKNPAGASPSAAPQQLGAAATTGTTAVTGGTSGTSAVEGKKNPKTTPGLKNPAGAVSGATPRPSPGATPAVKAKPKKSPAPPSEQAVPEKAPETPADQNKTAEPPAPQTPASSTEKPPAPQTPAGSTEKPPQ